MLHILCKISEIWWTRHHCYNTLSSLPLRDYTSINFTSNQCSLHLKIWIFSLFILTVDLPTQVSSYLDCWSSHSNFFIILLPIYIFVLAFIAVYVFLKLWLSLNILKFISLKNLFLFNLFSCFTRQSFPPRFLTKSWLLILTRNLLMNLFSNYHFPFILSYCLMNFHLIGVWGLLDGLILDGQMHLFLLLWKGWRELISPLLHWIILLTQWPGC